MLKLTTVFLLIGLIFVAAQGAPSQENIAVAAANGDWSAFQKLLSQGFDFGQNFEGIKKLQPQGPGSHVYGEAAYSVHKVSNINGQKIEQKSGRKVINKDGNVKEYELA